MSYIWALAFAAGAVFGLLRLYDRLVDTYEAEFIIPVKGNYYRIPLCSYGRRFPWTMEKIVGALRVLNRRAVKFEATEVLFDQGAGEPTAIIVPFDPILADRYVAHCAAYSRPASDMKFVLKGRIPFRELEKYAARMICIRRAGTPWEYVLLR